MFYDAAARFTRAKIVYSCLNNANANDDSYRNENVNVLAKFALLQHQWMIVGVVWGWGVCGRVVCGGGSG